MKKIFQYSKIGALLFVIVVMVSCKKSFLEIDPKGKLIAKTTNDYNMLLSNLDFVNVYTAFGSGMAQAPMGDEMASVDPYFSGGDLRFQRLFKWDDIIYEPDEDAGEMGVPMKNIYTFNKIINEVPNSIDGTEQQKKSIAAEAMTGRAWTYFLLINYYGKPYNATTSATDPGFPIITKADVTETQFTRASVKEVYDFIINDLTTAIPDLPDQITSRIRFAKPTAEGILGKVYMFMGMFDKALPHLNASIADLSSSIIPVGLYNYNTAFAPGGAFLPIGMFGPSYPTIVSNEENLLAKQFINGWTFTNNELVITSQTASLYNASDLRLNFYSTNAFFGGPYPNGMLRRIGPISASIGLMVSDLYLLRAECKARLSDLPGAVVDVETLRKNRMPVADASVPGAIAGDQEALVKFILEERIREFAVMGYRWFDMRRLSVDPVYGSTVNYTHTLYNEDGSVNTIYTLKPERLTMQLPRKVISQNPGMENNP